MKIPLSRPDITIEERNCVLGVLNTPFLSLGPKLAEFEGKFAQYVGSRYAVAVNSGTSGLHLCVKALDLKDGDEAITTPFSFIASANCLLYERVKPIFVDIDEETFNIDIPQLIKEVKRRRAKSKRLKAILAVHVFGRPCEMAEIKDLADHNELRIIEDACEAIGAGIRSPQPGLGPFRERQRDDWQKVGTFGRCGVFAFYPNKQITTGEGGMIVTNHEQTYRLCRSLRNQGRSEDGGWLQHERLGYNYRISDVNCALGIAQLERIDEILDKREKVALLYNQKLKEIDEIKTPSLEGDKRISWFVYVVRLKDEFNREHRDQIIDKLKATGIGCSDYFSPIHLQPFYKKMFGFRKGDFPVTEKISERTIALPFYNNLGEEQIDYVCRTLKEVIPHL